MGEFGGMITNNKNKTKWPVKRIGDLTSIASGSGFPNKYQGQREGDYPFYKVSDMNLFGNEVRMYVHNNAINEVFQAKLKAKVHPPGTIIFPKIGAAIATNKKRILTAESCFDNNVIGIHPCKNIDTNFLYHRLQCKNLSDFANTGNPPSIRKTTIEDWAIPLPPLAEQKRIAAILDAAAALRAKRRETLAQLDTLLQSTFFDMFGDPVTNPMGWQVVPFNRIGKFTSGATPRKIRDDFWNGLVPWVSPKDMKVTRIFDSQDHVSDLALKETNLKLLDPGNLLIVVRGMILVHSFPVATNAVPVTINQDMKGILPNRDTEVLFLLGCIRYMKRQILSEVSTAGHGTKRFDIEAMKKILIPHPPLSLQRRFATIFESIERQKTRQRTHLAELDTLFASLQSRAFNGEL